ncbi:Ammonia channel precursor [compost metagenome]
MPAHNLSLTMAGAAMLWVGWFGFNIGSGGGLSGTSGIVMLNTQLGACAGILGWMFTVRWRGWWALPLRVPMWV